MSAAQASERALVVEGLDIGFEQPGGGLLPAVRDLTFSVRRGQTLAVVGESGCGKSLTALALLGLVPPPGRVRARRLEIAGQPLPLHDGDALRRMRGNRISMIFQEPMTALNPVLTIGEQLTEVLHAHRSLSARQARAQAIEWLARVRLPDPATRFDDYPHRLSGGMRQRVMIAIALANAPAVLVADEPTTALDVTIQAEILALIDELKREHGTAVVLITHDLAVVAGHAEDVMVMYAGRAIERQRADRLFAAPAHPYTKALMAARPRPGARGKRSNDGQDDSWVATRSEASVAARGEASDTAGGEVRGAAHRVPARLAEIAGTVPTLARMPEGCPFRPRCPRAIDACGRAMPPPRALVDGQVQCLVPEVA